MNAAICCCSGWRLCHWMQHYAHSGETIITTRTLYSVVHQNPRIRFECDNAAVLPALSHTTVLCWCCRPERLRSIESFYEACTQSNMKPSVYDICAYSCSPSFRRPAPRLKSFGFFAAVVSVAIVIAAAAINMTCPIMLAARNT